MDEREYQYWKKIDLENKRKIVTKVTRAIGLICAILWIWLFGETFANYWKNLSWHTPQNKTAQFEIPQVIPPRPATPELQFPKSGSIIQYQQPNGTTANFTVVSEQGRTENCVIKLETWNEGIPAIELFVRAGEQAETTLAPLGDYRVKIACGKHWYGRNKMFGEYTKISTGINPIRFWKEENNINGQRLTLTQQIDGNFKTISSYSTEF